jgi:hypothetical protein
MGRFLLPHPEQQDPGHADKLQTIDRLRRLPLGRLDKSDRQRVPVRPEGILLLDAPGLCPLCLERYIDGRDGADAHLGWRILFLPI